MPTSGRERRAKTNISNLFVANAENLMVHLTRIPHQRTNIRIQTFCSLHKCTENLKWIFETHKPYFHDVVDFDCNTHRAHTKMVPVRKQNYTSKENLCHC